MININEILEHLKHSKLVLQEWIDSLSTTTPEIDDLIEEIRDNITQCHNAIERQDIDAFYSLENICADLFVKLDWLIVNL
jgi:hypothetical protein